MSSAARPQYPPLSLENPSGTFNESSRAFVSIASKIYVVRGVFCHKNELDCSHSPCLLSRRQQQEWSARVDFFHPSNIGVQLFEHAYLDLFCAVHEADAHLQTRRRDFIPARQLLTIVQKTPRPSLGEISKSVRGIVPFIGTSRRGPPTLTSRSSI